jgi:hypothetical protein
MLPYQPRRLVIAQQRVDFRKQWDGLLGESYRMGFDPYNGDCVVFIKRDKTQLRALMGDARGLILIARRFEGGCLELDWVFQTSPCTQTISSAQLTMLLEGATCQVHKRVADWKKGLPSGPVLG